MPTWRTRIEPALTSAVPVSGGAGLVDVALRSEQPGVPEAVFRLSRNDLAVFLRNLCASCGSVRMGRTQRNGPSVQFALPSDAFAGDVAALLLRFGIVARIVRVRGATGRPELRVVVRGAASSFGCQVRGPRRFG